MRWSRTAATRVTGRPPPPSPGHRPFIATMTVGTPFLPKNVATSAGSGSCPHRSHRRACHRDRFGLLALSNTSRNGLDIDYRFDLNLAAVLLGMIILANAEVFRYGLTLQAESDLTV